MQIRHISSTLKMATEGANTSAAILIIASGAHTKGLAEGTILDSGEPEKTHLELPPQSKINTCFVNFIKESFPGVDIFGAVVQLREVQSPNLKSG